jgi:hypothetical protein
VRVWGKAYRRAHRIQHEYGTLAGNVSVIRTLYREVGTRSGPALDPVAQRAGVVDGSWLPRTARAMAHLIAQGTSREAHATSEELLRLPCSRSSFERVGHEVGKESLRRRRQIEPGLVEALEIPAEARWTAWQCRWKSRSMSRPRRSQQPICRPFETPHVDT